MTITLLPDPPSRNDAEAVFVEKSNAFLGALPTFGTEANALAVDVNAAAEIAGGAIAAANFKGNWSALTGALAVPASVRHSGKFWLLASDVADVTTKTPGVAAEWLELPTGTVSSVATGAGLTGGPITASGTVSADIATNANIYAGTSNKLVAAGQIYTANAPVVTSGSGSFALNLNAGRVFQRTLTGNSTLANPTNQVAGQSGVIYIIQDATGGRTLSLGANFKPIGGAPGINTGANKVNVFSYLVRSATNISLSYLGAE